jgi:hypothetical protein
MLLQKRFLSGFLIPEDFCGLKQVLRGYEVMQTNTGKTTP